MLAVSFPSLADAVEKGFFSFDRVRLIQDQAQARNVDSKNQSSRFDCCVFLFHSFRAVTFSTASVRNRKPRREQISSAIHSRADEIAIERQGRSGAGSHV